MAAVVIATAIANTNCLYTIRRVHFFLSLALSLARSSFFFFSKDIVEGASLFSIPLYYIQFSAGVCQTFSTIRNSCVGTVFHLSYMVDGIKERWCAYILFSLSLSLSLASFGYTNRNNTIYVYMHKNLRAILFTARRRFYCLLLHFIYSSTEKCFSSLSFAHFIWQRSPSTFVHTVTSIHI